MGNQIKLKNSVLIFLIIFLFVTILNYLLGYVNTRQQVAIILYYTLAYTFTNIYGIWLVYILLNKYMPRTDQLKKRAVIGIILAILVCVFTAIIVNIFAGIVFYKKDWNEIITVHFLLSNSLFPIFIGIIVVLVIYIINFYKELYQGEVRKQGLIVDKISSQYESLQQQLSPHFLFNSLNVLDSLIEENPILAQEFTQNLSSIYRYVLEQQTKDFTTVGEELAFVDNYMRLMEKRFEGAVKISISDKIDKNKKIFPLSIQLLIENAFKHNGLSEKCPLEIQIEGGTEEFLIIKNNLIPKRKTQPTIGKGLQNIQMRYSKLGLSLLVKKTDKQFIVQLPLINKNYKMMEESVEQNEKKEKRLKELKKFYKTVKSYILTITICVGINLFTSWDKIFFGGKFNFQMFWAFWVIFPWGIVILSKAIFLFWISDSNNSKIEE